MQATRQSRSSTSPRSKESSPEVEHSTRPIPDAEARSRTYVVRQRATWFRVVVLVRDGREASRYVRLRKPVAREEPVRLLADDRRVSKLPTLRGREYAMTPGANMQRQEVRGQAAAAGKPLSPGVMTVGSPEGCSGGAGIWLVPEPQLGRAHPAALRAAPDLVAVRLAANSGSRDPLRSGRLLRVREVVEHR